MMHTVKHLKTATIMGGLLLFSTVASHANDSRTEALTLAQSLSSVEPVAAQAPPLREANNKTSTRRLLMDRLLERNDEDIESLFNQAHAVGVENLDIHKSYADIAVFQADNEKVVEDRIRFLTSQTQSPDWKRQNLAFLYLGNNYVFEQDNLIALEYAQKALEAIPSGASSIESDDARYETYDLLYTTFIVDRNIEKAIDATAKLVQIGTKTNRNISKVTIIHNLAVLFSKAHDFETASELSEILITLQDGKPDWQQAVANYGHGTNLSEAGHYARAVPYLEKAAQLAKGTRFEDPSNIRLTLAYAKTGQTSKAQRLLKYLDIVAKPDDQTWIQMKPFLMHARAEVAFSTGQYREGYIYLQDWVEYRNQTLEELLTEDRRRASEGLALSERVSQEREARLKSEITSSKEIAKRGNMIALFAALLAVALGFITFNLDRQRKRQVQINAELAVARDRALAGEKAKAKFLSMMGHELRTPMNPIISLSDILYTRSDDIEVKQMLKLISSSGRSMLSMVENILIVSDDSQRKLQVSTQSTRLRDFVRFTSGAFQRDAEDKGLKFITHIDQNVPEFMEIDKLKLKSILTNILSNAVKFTEKGTIQISFMLVQDTKLGVCLLVSIKDTGLGMSKKDIADLKAVFQQRDSSNTKAYDGVGVGLYVSELYTKAHGGRFDITSHPQDGTRVDIYLPYITPTEKTRAA